MLSKFILSSYAMLIEIALWVTLIGGLVVGAMTNGFMGAISGLLGAFVFSVTFYGGFLIVNDIRDSVKSINDKK